MYFCKEISILIVNNSYLAKYVQISSVLLSNYILICDIVTSRRVRERNKAAGERLPADERPDRWDESG